MGVSSKLLLITLEQKTVSQLRRPPTTILFRCWRNDVTECSVGHRVRTAARLEQLGIHGYNVTHVPLLQPERIQFLSCIVLLLFLLLLPF